MTPPAWRWALLAAVVATALAVLALRRQGLAHHERTQEGLRFIANRAIATGGWNYGANVVFERNLRPHPAPTGLALLALVGTKEHAPIIDRGIAYLETALPKIRAPQSLCWGLLGLTAWAHRPPDAETWLAEAYQRSLRRGESPAQLGYLLLAAADRSLEILGIETCALRA